jgi:hypothetical protein
MGVYICNTEQDDVKKALENLKERENLDILQDKGPQIIQVGIKKYASLKKASFNARKQEVEKKKITHVININTMTTHKKKCLYTGTNTVTGYLVNVKAAGLRLCKHCM